MNSSNQNRLELALKASNEGIWKWDLKSDEIHYSELLIQIMGYSQQSEAPHLLTEIEKVYHAEDQAIIKQELASFMKPDGAETFGAECRYLHPDHSLHWFRIRGACHRNNDGSPTLVAGSVIDISVRKRAELLLAEEKHLLSLLSESIPVNIYFKNKNSEFVMANTATAKKMGFSDPKHIIGNSDHDYFDVRHADKSRKDEVTIMETGKKLEGTLEKETWNNGDKEIEVTWCVTSKHPWFDRNGNIKGTFGVSHDVSEIVNTQTRLVEVAQAYKDKNDLYSEELKLASEVQQAILSRNIPSLPYDTASNSLPYSTDITVDHTPMEGLAGDFYEAIPISETKMGILLCDVMGHGIRASLIVAMLRGLITKEQQSNSTPEQFLSNLNHGLCHILEKSGVTMFSTACYCVIDVASGTVSIANAGHPLPIFKSSAGYRIMDSSDIKVGPALGLISESNYQSSSIRLDNITEMILYTDGIYEVVDTDNNELGIESLIEQINQLHNRPPYSNRSSIENLAHIAKDYSYNKQYNDDVCMLNININKSSIT